MIKFTEDKYAIYHEFLAKFYWKLGKRKRSRIHRQISKLIKMTPEQRHDMWCEMPPEHYE